MPLGEGIEVGLLNATIGNGCSGSNLCAMSAADNFEVVVGADGRIDPDDLARHGVRPGEHLRIAHGGSKRPPFRSIAGRLAGTVPPLSWEDFKAGSSLAAADAEAGPTVPTA